ncbi:MAG: twin-arginine translocation signal domain-containing protein [Planctomycetota bacterium]|nr:twin-arginine translocation signal domain-containing protein [Planctomycetota bacterium]
MPTNRRDFMLTAGVGGAALFAAGKASANEPLPRDSSGDHDHSRAPFVTEMFLDNHLLDSTPGVSRRLHPAKKHLLNPVVRCDRWSDGTYLEPYSTMYDEEEKLFKMWARAGSDSKAGYLGGNAAWILYFTSKDGVQWEKPDLGVMEVAGRRDHNIVFVSDMVLKSPTNLAYGPEKFVVPTTAMVPQGKKAFFWGVNRHPQPRDPSENYVALAIVQDHRRGAHIVTSPDGIHWSCAATPFWQTPHDVAGTGDDCLMHLMFDEAKRKWVIYRRIIPEFSERMIADDRDLNRPPIDRYNRSYAYAESEDLKEWTNHQFILAMDPDDPADTELYQFGCHKFAQTYIGYVSIFYLRRPQPIDIHLATSRDGIRFTRVCRGTPFIPHGALGNYDFMAMACSQPKPIVVNDTIYLYYAALNFPHNVDQAASKHHTGGVALATLKRDRFASLETGIASAGPHRMITKPFVVRHPRLYLNAATWEKGSIRVEVLTRDWQPIAGFAASEAREIQGDALDLPVRWQDNADVSKLVGREVRLKFHMTRARIHAMTLSHAERPLGEVELEYRSDANGDSAPKLN